MGGSVKKVVKKVTGADDKKKAEEAAKRAEERRMAEQENLRKRAEREADLRLTATAARAGGRGRAGRRGGLLSDASVGGEQTLGTGPML
jgi:hypothetical protein